MAFLVAEPCDGVKDTACVDICPVDCIHPRKDEGGFAGARQLYNNSDECIDCGARVPVCPVAAIFVEDLPAVRRHNALANAEFYARPSSTIPDAT